MPWGFLLSLRDSDDSDELREKEKADTAGQEGVCVQARVGIASERGMPRERGRCSRTRVTAVPFAALLPPALAVRGCGDFSILPEGHKGKCDCVTRRWRDRPRALWLKQQVCTEANEATGPWASRAPTTS